MRWVAASVGLTRLCVGMLCLTTGWSTSSCPTTTASAQQPSVESAERRADHSFDAADEPALDRSLDPAAPLQRGLDFLVRDAQAWREEHQCVSCHHAALVVWSLVEARHHGHAVDELVLAELTQWMAESGDGRVSLPRPEAAPDALNTKALYFALALSLVSSSDLGAADEAPWRDPAGDIQSPDEREAVVDVGRTALLATLLGDQTEEGAWVGWPQTRPPIFGPSDESMTALAVLALLPAAEHGDGAAQAARDRGLTWLEAATDDDPQSLALRVVVACRANRPAATWEPLVRQIRERQRDDGGWSQSGDMTSDAWATGQALYALSHAGASPEDPAVLWGRAFLIRTQRDDGAWPMTSRPMEAGGAGAESLVPITAAGSAWAVLGLVRTEP